MRNHLIMDILLHRKPELDPVLTGTTVNVLREHGLHDEADHVAKQAITRQIQPAHGQTATVGTHHSYWCSRCAKWVDILDGDARGAERNHILNIHVGMS